MQVNDFWGDRSVFLTGCTGLLGSWMIAELVGRGAKVTGLVQGFMSISRVYNEFFKLIAIYLWSYLFEYV